MTLLQTAVVSRKTPRDGKLEITQETAAHLGASGTEVPVSVDGQNSIAVIASMPCGCQQPASHVVHLFLQADAFRLLEPNSTVSLQLDPESSVNRVLISRSGVAADS